jgi:hypothetical protein
MCWFSVVLVIMRSPYQAIEACQNTPCTFILILSFIKPSSQILFGNDEDLVTDTRANLGFRRYSVTGADRFGRNCKFCRLQGIVLY